MNRTPRTPVAVLGLVLGTASLAVLLLSAAYDPAQMAAGGPLADLGAWLGVDFAPCSGCAWCGMSRAFACMTRGDVAAAVDLNAGVLLHWPLALALAVLGPWVFVRHLLARPRTGS